MPKSSKSKQKGDLQEKKAKLVKLKAKLREILRQKVSEASRSEPEPNSDTEDVSFQHVASSTQQHLADDDLIMGRSEHGISPLPTFRFVLQQLLDFIDLPDNELELLFTPEDWILSEHMMPEKRINKVENAPDDEKFDEFFKQLEEYKLRIANADKDSIVDTTPAKIRLQRGPDFQKKVKHSLLERVSNVKKQAEKSFDFSHEATSPRKILKAGSFVQPNVTHTVQDTSNLKRSSSDAIQSQAGEPLEKLTRWADELRAENQFDLADKLLELSQRSSVDTSDENSSLLSNSISKFAADQLMNNWKFAPFAPSQESNFIVGEFRRYVEKFNMFADSVGCNDNQKKVLLQFSSGETISKAFDAIVCRGKSSFDSFQAVVKALIEYWSRGTDDIAIETFFKTQKQKDSQTFTEFLEQLRNTSYNVANIFSQANPGTAQENMILHTFADGIRDESLQRYANELAVMCLKPETKSTNRLDRLEGKTIAADRKSSVPQNMFERGVNRVSLDHDQSKPTFKGEYERGYKHNSMVPSAPRGRGMMRSFGYRQSESNNHSFNGRQYRGQTNEFKADMQYTPNFCDRCKQHGHRTKQIHRCPMANRQPTGFETRGQYTVNSFARPQGNMFDRPQGNAYVRNQGNTFAHPRTTNQHRSDAGQSPAPKSGPDATPNSSVKLVTQTSEFEEVRDDFESINESMA